MRLGRTATAWLLALVCFLLYLSNVRVMGQWDSIPARLLPFSLLRQGNIDLNEFPWLTRDSWPYFARVGPGKTIVSGYPIATALLATPFYVPAVWWAVRTRVDLDDVRFRLAAMISERIAASAIAAISVALVFLAACTMTTERTAAAVALVYGLGTSVWCVSSQALWQHGPAQMALAGLSLFLLRPESRRTTIGAALFAVLAVAVRPSLAIFVAAAAVVVLLERRRDKAALAGFFAILAAGAVGLAAYNYVVFGALAGGYQAGVKTNVFVPPSFGRFAGLWVSPNRGLLIYTPAVLLAFAHPFLRRRGESLWLDLSLLGTLAYAVVFAGFRYWWAGYNYGPRYMIDPLPLLALAAVPAIDRLWRRTAGRVVVVALATYCIMVQVIGVYYDSDAWNSRPTNVNFTPERLWDWSDPQILRAAREGWHGSQMVPLLRQAMSDAPPAYLRPMVRDLVGTFRWSDGRPQFHSGERLRVQLDVVNRSRASWPALTDWGWLHVRFLYRWVAISNAPAKGIGWTTLSGIPLNLASGESLRIVGAIRAPEQPGIYRLEIVPAQAGPRGRPRTGRRGLIERFAVLPPEAEGTPVPASPAQGL